MKTGRSSGTRSCRRGTRDIDNFHQRFVPLVPLASPGFRRQRQAAAFYNFFCLDLSGFEPFRIVAQQEQVVRGKNTVNRDNGPTAFHPGCANTPGNQAEPSTLAGPGRGWDTQTPPGARSPGKCASKDESIISHLLSVTVRKRKTPWACGARHIARQLEIEFVSHW